MPEARRQQAAWTKFIDYSHVKAFVNVAISPAVEWGTRNIVLNSGLGALRPNIAVMGFYNLEDFRRSRPLVDITLQPPEQGRTQKPSRHDSHDQKLDGLIPIDGLQRQGQMSITSYVTILEDLLLKLQINVAVARGFRDLEFPHDETDKLYIDLWPIQMSAEIASEGANKPNVLTTNFDTCKWQRLLCLLCSMLVD